MCYLCIIKKAIGWLPHIRDIKWGIACIQRSIILCKKKLFCRPLELRLKDKCIANGAGWTIRIIGTIITWIVFIIRCFAPAFFLFCVYAAGVFFFSDNCTGILHCRHKAGSFSQKNCKGKNQYQCLYSHFLSAIKIKNKPETEYTCPGFMMNGG